ncbi:MAG: TRAP transporter small permease [Rhizobiaceae bacterium]
MEGQTPAILIRADNLIGKAAQFLALVGSLGIIGLVMITIVAVAWRYGLNDPIFGIEDLSIVTLTIVAGAAVAYGARTNAHVSISVIRFFGGRRLTRYTDAIMRVLTVAILALATYSLFAKACGIEKACITNNFSIEHRYFYYYLGISMGVYALHILVHFLISLYHFGSDDPNEIDD